jgi:hypothetical protein
VQVAEAGEQHCDERCYKSDAEADDVTMMHQHATAPNALSH